MNRLAILICLIALNLPMPALAQQAERHGEYIIHYNTMNTRLLAPEFARAYGIARDGNRALINIAVLRVRDGDMDEPVTARVSVSSSNLAGQRRDIELSEVQDQGAIYYVGSFRIRNEENMNFRVRVHPDGAARPHEFTFRQTVYAHD
ncbi:MAG: DUF4426 domain-containing protein [Wenzhouxiangella sp.]